MSIENYDEKKSQENDKSNFSAGMSPKEKMKLKYMIAKETQALNRGLEKSDFAYVPYEIDCKNDSLKVLKIPKSSIKANSPHVPNSSNNDDDTPSRFDLKR